MRRVRTHHDPWLTTAERRAMIFAPCLLSKARRTCPSFSGPINGHACFLKGHMAEDRVDLLGVFRCVTTPLGRARTNSISMPSAPKSPWSFAMSQGRLNTVPLISLTTFSSFASSLSVSSTTAVTDITML